MKIRANQWQFIHFRDFSDSLLDKFLIRTPKQNQPIQTGRLDVKEAEEREFVMHDSIKDAASLLDVIRQEEAEVTKRLAAARETAVHEIELARQQAREKISAAKSQGQREGEANRRAILAETESEAERIVTQARAEAEALRHVTPTEMETAVHQALAVVIGDGYGWERPLTREELS